MYHSIPQRHVRVCVRKHDDHSEGKLEVPTSVLTARHTVSGHRIEGDASVLQAVVF